MNKVFYDFHIHSCLSPCGDNEMTPANIAGMAFLNGLNAIALTDHNTTKNCKALKKAAEQYGITVLYGMELTTEEEVHIVCLFADEYSAEGWNDFVYSHLIKIKNNPNIFGQQLITDSNDNILGEEENLLINATNISFENAFDLINDFNGIAFPAHIDKSANSLISNLGFVPPESKFKIAEIHNLAKANNIMLNHPYFNNCTILSSSDAHYLPDISRGTNYITPKNNSPEEIIKFLKGTAD